MKFFEIAEIIEEVTQLYGQLANIQPPQEKPESVLKYLRALGDSHFLAVMGSKRTAISYSLLKYLGYEIE